jgi:hypothetical protein
MPASSRYQLSLPADQRDTGLPMCVALILAPSVETTEPSRTQYVVFFGDIPARYAAQATAGNPDYAGYAPNMGVLKVSG